MINNQSNMGREQIFKELPTPDKVEEKGIFKLIYKAIFICVKLLLDIRLNLVWISEGKVIKPRGKRDKHTFKRQERKPDNPIKGLDKIKNFKEAVKIGDEQISKGQTTPYNEELNKKMTENVMKKVDKLQEGSVKKGGVNDFKDVKKPDGQPKGQTPSVASDPNYITLGESEKEKKELEKGNDEKTS